MAKVHKAICALNRGLISRLGIARVDLKRAAMSSERQVNWIPRVLGSMMLRPGLGYLGSSLNNNTAKYIPFIFSTNDTALIEVTEGFIRVWVDDAVVTRPSVTAAVTNGNFNTDLSGWNDADEAGAVSQWFAGGYMELIGTGTNAAIRDQFVGCFQPGTEHALRIVVQTGPVTLKVGSTVGGNDYIEAELAQGTHSLAFTPSGNFNIRFQSRLLRATFIDSCNIEASGVMTIPAPWQEEDLFYIRWDQSADVVFVACRGYQQRRIERRGVHSWSVVLYLPDDGPFRTENVGPITITPSALTGNITLAASAPLFASTNVGGLYAITSSGQRVAASISSDNTFTNPITVTGVGEQRRYAVEITNTWTGTVTVQRSIGVVGNWVDVTQFTGNVTTTDNDGLDNQTVYYRIGIKAGDYGSGTADVALSYTLGSIDGVVRITGFTTSQLVNAEVLTALGDTVATTVWAEGQWSARRGWPSAVALYEGRLWWAGKDKINGSISDAFDKFDPNFEGDAGPINRSIGSGPVDDINWILPMQRLLVGADGAEFSVRSTTFDEPLTPTNFNIKQASTQGSNFVAACKMDSRGVFVQRSFARVYQMSYSVEVNDYISEDLTALVPEIGAQAFFNMAVQRQPDTRIHCLRTDGTVALAVLDQRENVLSWQEIETFGQIEDVVVLPQNSSIGDPIGEDNVYYSVRVFLPYTLIGITLSFAGNGYSSVPDVVISGGGGSGAEAECTLTLASIPLVFSPFVVPGSGYSVNDDLTLVGGTSTTPVTLNVTSVDGSGGITGLTITDGGDYSELPTPPLQFTGGTGSGFEIPLNQNPYALWIVNTLTLTEQGSDYVSLPSVVFIGGSPLSAATGFVVTSSLTGTFRYLTKWAKESECRGGTFNKQADQFITYAAGIPTQTISGLNHIIGQSVVVWGDGADMSTDDDEGEQTTYIVNNSGQITLPSAVSYAVVGLPYQADWQSARPAFATDDGTALSQITRITQVGFIMADYHTRSIKHGPDFDNLDPMPIVDQRDTYDARVVPSYDPGMVVFAGTWNPDSRLCVRAYAPRPVTALAMVMSLEVENKG